MELAVAPGIVVTLPALSVVPRARRRGRRPSSGRNRPGPASPVSSATEALAAGGDPTTTPPALAAPDGAAQERPEHQRDALAGALEAMKDERGAARREHSELLSGADATLAARVAAERERDAAVAQRDAAVEELQSARSQRAGRAAGARDGSEGARGIGCDAGGRAPADARVDRRGDRVLAVLAALLLGAVL